MSYRFMRMLVFFDLPTITQQDRREYRKFRKFLINEGYIMMQESIYSKLLLNSTAVNLMQSRLEKGKPKKGLVQSLIITERQFSSINYIVGENSSVVKDDDNRIVII